MWNVNVYVNVDRVGGIRSRSASQNQAASTKGNLTNNVFVKNTHGEVLDLRGNTLQLMVISDNWYE